jgi:hypothetical protein
MTKAITWDGITQGVSAWSRDPRCVVKEPTLRARLTAGATLPEAMTAPAEPQGWLLIHGADLRRRARALAASRGTTATDIATEALRIYLDEHDPQ